MMTVLPGSPYAAGFAPTQMAVAQLTSSGSSAASLYASDSGDPNGGILAFAVASDGSLSPIAGSPFATTPNAAPSYLLSTSNSGGDQFLFVSLSNAGQIAGFSIDNATGALAPIPGSPFTAGKGPGMLISGIANELIVINTGDHTVEAFNISAIGVLTPNGSPAAVGTANAGIALQLERTQPSSPLFAADTAASSIDIVNVDNSSGAISAGETVAASSPPLQLAIYDQFPLP
jgi:6-phosphogluconolactonase (cycloisomerase 2 family)